MKQSRKHYLLPALALGLLLAGGLAGCSDDKGDEPVKPDPADTLKPQPPLVTDTLQMSPFMTRVLEYRPAPGQFVGTMPGYEEGDTEESMRLKAEGQLAGENKNQNIIALGSWGGYVVIGFDHTVPNLPGRDLQLRGNGFDTNGLVQIGDYPQGSSEPGVVYVAQDKNHNGKPDDDEWYELKGAASEPIPWQIVADTTKGADGTYRVDKRYLPDYEVTYQRPSHEPDPAKDKFEDHGGWSSYEQYVHWTDNQGASGWVPWNSWHDKNQYYPEWVKDNTMTFRGRLLPQNVIPTGPLYWAGLYYGYGYVDNGPNTSLKRLLASPNGYDTFDIDWAMDKDGKPVKLTGIDFVKIQTGTFVIAGWTGNVSTEFGGATDIHVYRYHQAHKPAETPATSARSQRR